ncbi:hypothetical protein GA0115241_102419 [Streptomyces sp. DpondAA-D4]|nr:hypothetical protein GA0115241_102419 [Streptomyces sp. DpondAA-D4]SCE06328.1 hypothetical protein GA0115249_112619 [Streptomyces sp. PpalLS-921]
MDRPHGFPGGEVTDPGTATTDPGTATTAPGERVTDPGPRHRLSGTVRATGPANADNGVMSWANSVPSVTSTYASR